MSETEQPVQSPTDTVDVFAVCTAAKILEQALGHEEDAVFSTPFVAVEKALSILRGALARSSSPAVAEMHGAFRQWAADNDYPLEDIGDSSLVYGDPKTDAAWEAFQAAWALRAPERELTQPDGWAMVPVTITLAMQKAFFEVIDRNLPRVQTDATSAADQDEHYHWGYQDGYKAASTERESGWEDDDLLKAAQAAYDLLDSRHSDTDFDMDNELASVHAGLACAIHNYATKGNRDGDKPHGRASNEWHSIDTAPEGWIVVPREDGLFSGRQIVCRCDERDKGYGVNYLDEEGNGLEIDPKFWALLPGRLTAEKQSRRGSE